MVKDTRIIRIFYENVANPQPSPNDRYARSMDAVQRLNVNGPDKF